MARLTTTSLEEARAGRTQPCCSTVTITLGMHGFTSGPALLGRCVQHSPACAAGVPSGHASVCEALLSAAGEGHC